MVLIGNEVSLPLMFYYLMILTGKEIPISGLVSDLQVRGVHHSYTTLTQQKV